MEVELIIENIVNIWTAQEVADFLNNLPANSSFTIDSRNVEYNTALSYMAKEEKYISERDREVFKLLLKHGADPLQKVYYCDAIYNEDFVMVYSRNDTVISRLAANRESSMLIQILQNVEDIDTYVCTVRPGFYKLCLCQDEMTPLQLSIIFEMDDVFQYVMSRMPDVNKTTLNRRYTALHFAVLCKKNLEMTKILLEYGANPNTKNGIADRPFFLALELGKLEDVKMLIEYGVNVIEYESKVSILRSFFYNLGRKRVDLKLLKFLLKSGCSPQKFRGSTVHILFFLLGWRIKNKKQCSKILIRYGAKWNVQDPQGNTLLHSVAQKFPQDIAYIKFLLILGVDWTLRNGRNETFFDILMELNRQTLSETLNFMMSRGKNFQYDKIEELARLNQTLRMQLSCCRKELEVLNEIIDDAMNVSLSTLYNMKEKRLSKICGVHTINSAMKTFVEEDFPIYGTNIKAKFNRALERYQVESTCMEYLENIYDNVLRFDVAGDIVDHISTRDLGILKEKII